MSHGNWHFFGGVGELLAYGGGPGLFYNRECQQYLARGLFPFLVSIPTSYVSLIEKILKESIFEAGNQRERERKEGRQNSIIFFILYLVGALVVGSKINAY